MSVSPPPAKPPPTLATATVRKVERGSNPKNLSRTLIVIRDAASGVIRFTGRSQETEIHFSSTISHVPPSLRSQYFFL